MCQRKCEISSQTFCQEFAIINTIFGRGQLKRKLCIYSIHCIVRCFSTIFEMEGCKKGQYSILKEKERFLVRLDLRGGQLDEDKMVLDEGGGKLVTTAFGRKHNPKKSQLSHHTLPESRIKAPLCLPTDPHFSQSEGQTFLD